MVNYFPQHQLVPQPVLEKYVGEDDIIILEDELQRIQLTGDRLDVQRLVTGEIFAGIVGIYLIFCWDCRYLPDFLLGL